MEAGLNPAQLLQWYADIGVDEAIGETSPDRRQQRKHISEKAAPLSATSEAPSPVSGTVESLKEATLLASGAKTLEELKAVLENFQGLSLKRTATQIVFSDGTPTAKVMLVGEAPGTEEDRAGRPFAGAQGELLDKMLAAIGLNRDSDVYITTVINWRPPGNRVLSDTEVALSLPFIQRHIELVNPEVLICVGGGAAKALLLTSKSILRLRGKWMDYTSEELKRIIPSLAMLTPAYLMGSPSQKKLAWADLLMLKEKLIELGVL
ncbi:MAG: uracil-DNA glycosylase [Alphaproteobacteria bacterium]|nr:uracil-DNA glycosylase [Alphaproteobacteria bacterium]